MKKWRVITASVLVGVWLVASTIREFSANETIQYFSTAPNRLLYVVAIAVAGGFVAMVFDRLSPRTQRQVKLFSWGGTASLLTISWCYMLDQTASLSELIVRNAGVGWMIVVLLLLAALATYLWFAFFRTWKSRVSQ